MNRILSAAIVALVLVFPAGAFASVISLSPTSIPVTPGKVFTVNVMVNPNGAHIYTVRANISFDPALVSETAFKFSPKLLVLPMKGSDVVNNTTGVLIKTAGYIPSGITSTALFGTITFRAKKVGVAHISVTTKSTVLDANSKNTISGTQGSVKVVSTIPPLPKVTHKAKNAVYHATHKTVVKTAAQIASAKAAKTKAATDAAAAAVSAQASTTATSTAATSTLPTQTAAAAGSGTTGKTVPYAVAAGVIVLALLAWLNRKRLFSHAE